MAMPELTVPQFLAAQFIVAALGAGVATLAAASVVVRLTREREEQAAHHRAQLDMALAEYRALYDAATRLPGNTGPGRQARQKLPRAIRRLAALGVYLPEVEPD